MAKAGDEDLHSIGQPVPQSASTVALLNERRNALDW